MSVESISINRVLSLYHKIITLIDKFLKNDKYLCKPKACDFGYLCELKRGEKKYDIWIGLLYYENKENKVKDENNSLYIWFKEEDNLKIKSNCPEKYFYKELAEDPKAQKKGYYQYYFPIKTKDEAPPEFLYAETVEEQQEKFNTLLKENLTRLLTYIK